MGIAACDLSQYVIRPTLLYLERHSASAEALLLGAAACQSTLGSALGDAAGHGLYCISAQRHQALWDQHLARDPDLASRVRGLASQHAFLEAPHLELTVNLRYATAIAWLLVEVEALELPAADDLLAMSRIWCKVFQPQGHQRDFLDAWQRCIAPISRVA
ncbi:hypothetical protein [Ectopseudomonas mendocina]|jgi:hypothetical protein|uniref:Uncharacterized protein n=1 Tax=Ectopseudomonas mendocina TaxID=300 RepID=A0A2R3QHU8_ECTME|nr:hypothetical protein [Pseudomonas mendocina]AVO51287.1 hypothetical protein C7A17_00400 [Pseudomonas mendocina]